MARAEPVHSKVEEEEQRDSVHNALEWMATYCQAWNICALGSIVLLAALLRYATSLHPYSGAGAPPMFGDQEAQRHWMEVTVNLPLVDWYRNTTDNDLEYWGLDYPPLTAYHSLILGKIAEVTVPELVTLHESRGIETMETKLFMRLSALFTDLLIFFPAVIWTIHQLYPDESFSRKLVAIAFNLCVPSMILIDHGHFQYNSASLGLVIWAIGLLSSGHEFWSCVFFTFALCFKQMSLYFAPAFFFVMLSACFRKPTWSSVFFSVVGHGVCVLLSLLLCLLPFLCLEASSVADVFSRVFPFARGLYEDKVANFWCVSNVIIKWRKLFDQRTLVQLCLALTLISLIPNAILSGRNPSRRQLLYSLSSSSLAFFLFSFQVHEKSILLPLVPLSLLCLSHPQLSGWMSTISAFSLYPLLKKDGLVIAYLCWQVIGLFQSLSLPVRTSSYATPRKMSTIVMLLLHLVLLVSPSVPGLPHIEELVVAAYSSVHFFAFFCISLYYQAHETTAVTVATQRKKMQ